MKILIVVIIATLLAQLIKFCHHYIITGKFRFQKFFETGGIPSSHSSAISAMSFAVYFEEGFSTLFFISLIIAVMVIRDSFGIRYAVGQNTKRLNELTHNIVNEISGHTPFQVSIGIILGLVISLIAYA